jgi:hypothetical protein
MFLVGVKGERGGSMKDLIDRKPHREDFTDTKGHKSFFDKGMPNVPISTTLIPDHYSAR